MGVFRNHINGLPVLYVDTNNYEKLLNDYMIINHGNHKWKYADNSFYLKTPKGIEINTVIPISSGTENESYVGIFAKIIILNESHIDIIRGMRSTSFWQKTDTAVKINKIATYKLEPSLIPYVSMRLNLENSSKSRIIVLFIPRDSSKAIQIVRQSNILVTRHPCKRTIYLIENQADDNYYEEE